MLLPASLGALAGCSSGAPLDPDNAEQLLRARFPVLGNGTDAFATYRLASREWISARALSNRSAAEVELNLPFERAASPTVPRRGLFLLLHGLNDSPWVWHDLAGSLVERGYDVRAILFEGHGSSADDMRKVRMERWLDAARRHLDAVLAEGGPVYIGGFSMGGVIATRLALERPQVAGLWLLSPAFDSRLNHLLRWAGIYARVQPWVFGTQLLEDNPIKYNSIAVNSGWQYFRLTRDLKRAWGFTGRVTVPTLIVQSADDSVVDVNYTSRLFDRRFTHPASRLLTYRSVGSPAASDCRRCVSRDSASPGDRLLNASHLGLMYSPANPLFGRRGSVLVCNGNEYRVFMACMRGNDHRFGAQHTVSPDAAPMARSTFNPDWNGTLAAFDAVFDR